MSLSWPVPRDLTMKSPRVRFLPAFSSNSLTTIQVSIKDETPISPLVSFSAEEETRLVKNVVMPRDFSRSIMRVIILLVLAAHVFHEVFGDLRGLAAIDGFRNVLVYGDVL